jgi:hypothetical protein
MELQKALAYLAGLPEYSHYLKPLLKKRLHNKWLNPSDYKTQEEFLLAYNEELGYARAVKDILKMIDDASTRVEGIAKSMEPIKNVI